MTFTDYLKVGEFGLNYPLYTDQDGSLIVDKVIKYEGLLDELHQVFGRLKIPFAGSLNVRAKSGYCIDKRPYQEIYTSRQKDTIATAFAKEIKMHGYSF